MVVLILNFSCGNNKKTTKRKRADAGYVFIDDEKVKINTDYKDSIYFKSDSSYIKNKLLRKDYIKINK